MNKEEFLKKLRKKIDILEESEIDDILEEYAGFIDEKVSQGSTEEEAVKSMGNINELSRELLSAYKIKNPKEKNGDVINNFVDEFLKIIENIINVFANKSFKEIVRFIIEIVFIFLIIAICKIPFEMLRSMGSSILINMSSSFESVGVFNFIAGIGNMFLEICYLIFAIILFVKIFQSRYMNLEDEVLSKEKNRSKNQKINSKNSSKIVKEKPEVKIESRGLGIIDGLTNVCVVFIKVIAFCILVGVIFYVIGMTTAFGLSLYLLFRGVFYIGIYLIILALLVLGVIAFIVLFNFIFNRKSKLFIILISSLVCFVLIGIGIATCTVEFANTTFTYNGTYGDNKKSEVFEFDMKDNYVLDGYYNEMVIDETLKDKIKVEFIYNNEIADYSINPHTYVENDYEFLVTHYDIRHISYNDKLFEYIIDSLKKKEIVAYNLDVYIKIYVSSETEEKLNNNKRDYEKLINDENYELEEICESLYYYNYELPDYCLPFYSE